MANLPRLTGALRAFANVSSQDSHSVNTSRDLLERRRLQTELQSKDSDAWQSLVSLVKNNADAQIQDINAALKQLTVSAKAVVGNEASSDTVEGAASYLFDVFKFSRHVGSRETAKIRNIFGPFPASAATKACEVVQKIVSWLPEDVLSESDEPGRQEADGAAIIQEFGKNLKFSSPDSDGINEVLSSSESEEEKEELNFDLKYNSCSRSVPSKVEKTIEGAESKRFDYAWLLSEVKIYFPHEETSLGLTVTDLATSLFDVLCSIKTDEELQNELFELLGFDRFEMIESLLGNRRSLMQSLIEESAKPIATAGQKKKGDPQNRPAYGCQVTIQTEDEKLLKKQIRKEEKKISRRDGRKVEDGSDQGMDFDPQKMRTQREEALQAAAMTPLFPQRSSHYQPREKFPFVFDTYEEARHSSAYVGGCKLVLPAGFERKEEKTFEEVNIPPIQAGLTNVGKELIPISSLDEIGQLAFRGMKSLNRIQSVVFESAYRTNENLLICAPTGAGKTNIAMLAILHEIKQHLSQGVIKKDEFKIVYVAPMKALAAEMVRNFGGRLEPLGLVVRELTGDMSLTKAEILKTQMLVTTPEKWDVVTRKSTGDVALAQLVKLLIFDEIHLLHDDRGPVIESLVARTIRQVESSQSMIRIIGLSATLPNYLDVAHFLNVNPYVGLFFFDGRFRPVPLSQTFIGIKTTSTMQQMMEFNHVCYEKVLFQVKAGYQVMVFVHARNETVRTAMVLRDLAKNKHQIGFFLPPQGPKFGEAQKVTMRSRNKQLKELFSDGFAIHHAGMLRQDRNLVEKYFSAGLIKVLCCTATLAWGINLPAHAVIIKGTQIYDAKKGTFVDLGILDVMQIFGRAGRPQFDKFGHGTIITTHNKLSHYLSLMTRQNPIESQFINSLTDNLNAEIVLGTVTNVEEAVRWLSYTYLYVRMRINPLVYGISHTTLEEDPLLELHRHELIRDAGRKLDKAEMVRFDENTGYFFSTDLGRIASHFYIKYDTVEMVNETFVSLMTESDVFSILSKAQEFDQIKVRDDEMDELENLVHDACEMPVPGGKENTHGKVNILLQSYVSRHMIDSFSLVSDMSYVAQNATRIMRALFEIALKRGWPIMASRLLRLSKMVDKRLWGFQHPLRQFMILTHEILEKLERSRLTIDRLKEMTPQEIGHMIHHVKMGGVVKKCVSHLPCLDLDANIQPITRTVLRVRLTITPDFKWDDKVHGGTAEPFWIWVEDPDNNHIYHSEYFMLHKKQVVNAEAQNLVFTIPIFEPLPTQYYVKAISDRWLGSEAVCPISFQHLILPERHPPHTELLDLHPLPITALNDPKLEVLYKFSHFNPVQTQFFHTLYHTDSNVLLGAPTGSGKTVGAELAIFRVFREYPKYKAVYIAPLKALVRERMEDWKVRIEQKLGRKVVELTGDVTPDIRAIGEADLIVTTPEKWDGISRSWQTRSYVKAVALIVIDEIHLLGNDRGPVLEVVVSRTNFISSHTEKPVRVVGLSTALANARDLADWLGIKQVGLFNFRPSVRPVPLEVHIAGFPGQHYCPRMATMNKPTFQAIKTHSPEKPVLIFVSSRRQTRLTALDLIAYLAAEMNPKQWLHMEEMEMENLIVGIKDTNLKLTLAFGIGIHHAGLVERDRKSVEELFVNQKIQVLIATSTLAWGVNFPAHLVVIKGTEYFDGKTKRYVDFAITDVLQMMGRAGRPQFDDQGKAVILVHDIKKHFYKKFLYEPFPVESNLLEVLPDHLNAEIVAGTITSKQDAMDYITWTYFFRRLVVNPSYYNLDNTDFDVVNKFLSALVEKSLIELESSYCIQVGDDNRSVSPLTLGRISSYYYLNHITLRMFCEDLKPDSNIEELIKILSNAHEYDELPVRHNEDSINSELARKMSLDLYAYDSSHTKTQILLHAHFNQTQLPSTDYFTDTKSVLDQTIRILQAMLDVSADQGWLVTSLRVIMLIQMVVQARWLHDSSLLTLPNVMPYHLHCFKPRSSGGARKKGSPDLSVPIETLPQLMVTCDGNFKLLSAMLDGEMSPAHIDQLYHTICRLPQIEVSMAIKGWWAGDKRQQNEKPVNTRHRGGRRPESSWITIHADQEYVLKITLTRINKTKKHDSKASSPKFPKPKDEGWVLVVGDIENKEVIALKRVGYVRGRTTAQLALFTPESTGRVIYTLYLMSDAYLGLDQQYDLCLNVIPSNIEAQVNTELEGELADLDFGD
ncbi:activating signal cointegrator 1 complex subunit 3-like [Gigantopelta aegis]|uniref:activating signal cointegrator 1 complex subunit 3-like n=1 Tax=Gigantopelta aegis TaxID=1735272 RepID=UPI001B88B5B0|nr:activating signal cointegrator 1 complex subunit 3-like [Gigantopelta aegis]